MGQNYFTHKIHLLISFLVYSKLMAQALELPKLVVYIFSLYNMYTLSPLSMQCFVIIIVPFLTELPFYRIPEHLPRL